MGVEDVAVDAAAVVVCKHCSGEVCLAAAAEAGDRVAVGAEEVVSVVAALEAAVALAEVLGEAVTLVVEVLEAVGNADDTDLKNG